MRVGIDVGGTNRAGLAHAYVVYRGEGHGFRTREHRVDCYTRILRWFTRYLTA